MTKLLRRFNYTHRVRIPARKVHIEVACNGMGSCGATVHQLDLSERGTHPEAIWNAATVFLEARRLSTGSFSRRRLGVVEDIRNANLGIKVELPEFEDDSNITFRVKVVGEQGRLLADGDGIKAGRREESEREPLIDLVPADIGEDLWRIEWDPEGPRVLVNKRLPNCSGILTRDPLIRGLVIPHIIRHVLPEAVTWEQKSDRWVQKWLDFAKRICRDEPPDGGEGDIQDWVDNVVTDFAKSLKLVTLAEQHLVRLEET